MLKKIICFGLATALLIGISGCRPTKPTAGTGEDTGEPYNLVWYYIGGNVTQDEGLINEEINKITTKEINATIDMAPIPWASYESKMNTIVASGEAFDICFTAGFIFNVNNNIRRNAFLDITKYVDEHGANIKESLGERFFELIRTPASSGVAEGLYYVPAAKDFATARGFMYRKDLVDKYNIDIENINSFNELIPALDIIKKNETDVTPVWISEGYSPFTFIDFQVSSYPIGFYTKKDIGIPYDFTETPEFKEAAEMSRYLFQNGYTRKDAMIVQNVKDLKSQGEFFCWVEPLKPGKDKELAAGFDIEFIQHQVTEAVATKTSFQGATLAVSRTSKNPARAVKFIDLLYGEDTDILTLFNFGVEGKHYNMTANNRIAPIRGAAYARDGMQWMVGDTMKNYLLVNEDADKNEKMREFNESAKLSPLSGLEANIESIRTEIATCTSVRKEFQKGYETGSSDIETELPKLTAKLRQAGSDKIYEVFKEAAEQWLQAR